MKIVNIQEAKTNLSEYLNRVNKTHEIIVICENGIPIGQITEYKISKNKRIGALKDKLLISEDFDNMLPSEIIKDYT